MARFTGLQAYLRNPLPIMDGGEDRYVQEELRRVEVAFSDLVLMAPQPASAAPKIVRDGMIRLSRAPWRPIGGTADRWVFWDAVSSSWLALNGS